MLAEIVAGLSYPVAVRKAAVTPISHTDGGWKSLIREPFAGAWQRNIIGRTPKNVLTHFAVYACIDRIATDGGKLALRLMQTVGDIFEETESPAFSPVLEKPNRYQTTQKFIEQWLHSKLINGNTYVLKERDERNIVVALYVLDPTRVKVLVAPDGSIFYQIGADNLSGVEGGGLTVPQSEIIHDVNAALYHPLCGVSPITACALPAVHGLQIQEHSATFFANAANPGGILTAPGHINQETAELLKKQWEERYSGGNVGRILVAGDALTYTPMTINARDSQLIDQLKWSAEQVCSCFHVPAYKIGIGAPPAHNNIGALNTQYYSEALQGHLKSIQTLLRQGLSLPTKYRIWFDLEDLILMDTLTRVQIAKEGSNTFAPNESRKRFNLRPLPGGDTVYLQEQNFSLAALAKRDAKPDPFGTSPPPAPKPAADDEDDDSDEDVTRDLIAAIERKFHETRLAA